MKDDQDYSLTSMLQRAREAKGRPLTLEERARYVEMVNEMEKAQAELAEAQARAEESHEEKLASHRLIGKKRRKELRLETREDLEEELASVRLELLKLQNPETSLTPDLVERIEALAGNEIFQGIAQNRVDAGLNTSLALGLVDAIHEFVSEETPNITKREVMEAITGSCYGDGPNWYRRFFWFCKYWLLSKHINRFARWRHGLE